MLPIVVDNQAYLTAAEAARRLGIARETFNRNVGSRLRKYQFGALRRIYYLQSDVDAYSGLREVEERSSSDESEN